MNVFEKRPFSLILCIMLCGFSLFLDLDLIFKVIIISCAVALIVLIFVIRDLFGGRRTFVLLCLFSLILSVLFGIFFNLTVEPTQYFDQPGEIECIVEDVNDTSYESSLITVRTQKINDTEAEYKVLFFADRLQYDNIEVGDQLLINATPKKFATSGSFNTRAYYISRGYSFTLDNISSITILSIDNQVPLDFFKTLQDKLSEKLISYTNETTGGFLAALILGNNDFLDPHTKLSFTLIGISHILALSGAHLVIICEGLKFLLRLIGLNKKQICVVATVFTILYTIVTGCSPSIVRAAVMLTITNTLFLLEQTRDIYTTLPFAVALILLFDPRAVYDLSLWLSAFATLGIVFLSGLMAKEDKNQSILGKIFSEIKNSLLASFFAIGATILITIGSFSETSILSPLTTLIFTIPTTILIYVGLLMLLIPFNTPLSIIASGIGGAVRWLADYISRLDFTIISTEYTLVLVLTYIFAFVFFAFLILKTEKKQLITVLLTVLLLLPYLAGFILTQKDRSSVTGDYYVSEYYSDRIFINNEERALIFSGEQSPTSASNSVNKFKDNKIYYIDKLVIPCYQPGTYDYITRFTSNIKTGTVYIPSPENEYELDESIKIAMSMSQTSTKLEIIEYDEVIDLGSISFALRMRSIIRSDTKSEYIFDIFVEEKRYTYMTLGVFDTFGYTARELLFSTEHLIIGGYGTNNYGADLSLNSESIREIYISSKAIISKSAKEYYEKNGVPITIIGTLKLYIE